MKLEVCVDSLQSAANAIFNRVDELEVCSDLSVGGITPSIQFVKQIIDMVDLYINSYPIHLTIETVGKVVAGFTNVPYKNIVNCRVKPN